MNWQKLGLVYCPDGVDSMMHNYATNPFAVPINSSTIKIFFSTRDKENHSHVFNLLLELDGLKFKVVKIEHTPVLSPGQAGLFDDDGITFVQYFEHAGKGYIYYLGWNTRIHVPFQNSLGLAISEKGVNGPFIKYSKAPIIDRNYADPYTISYGYVFPFGTGFKMIYGACLEWNKKDIQESVFVFREAFSDDLKHWERSEGLAMEMHEGETAVARPCILKDPNGYKMWYSYKMKKLNSAYRIGYAVSDDTVKWTRKDDEAGIEVSGTGWDSNMVSYAHVFDFRGRRYMLYNGNHYGKSGFGLAILEA